MTQNHELSEEMTQDAFVKAYQHLSSYDGNRAFKPWLFRIASNTAISQLRKQSKVVSLNALQDDGAWGELEDPTHVDPLVLLETSVNAQQVAAALETLDVKYRQVLLLRYQEELSYEEISEALAVPLNTVRTWLKRGLEKLKQQVQEIS